MPPKYSSGNWSAAPFFANAKGPFAEHYRTMVWDYNGTIRRDMDQSMLLMAIYRDQVANHYDFDETQSNQAQAKYAAAVESHKALIEGDEWKDDLEEYDLGLERLRQLDSDPMRDGVESLKGQRETIRRERESKIKPFLAAIDKLWTNYQTSMNAIATSEQQATYGTIKFNKPLGMNTGSIDRFVPYFDIAIGLCLLLGLFTPVAALAAACFLGSVFLSQYPPSTGPSSSNYQLIEAMACLVLAGTAAGRFAGLDYFLHLIIRKVYGLPDRRRESR